MTTRRFLALAGSVLLLSLGLVGLASPAGAVHVTCGQTILVTTVLDANVGPCATGLTIGASNITLDLNGFTISGNPGAGEDAGITLDGRTGVTVKNGTVTLFDAGVAVLGGSANTVVSMKVVDNRGSGANFGDGIALFSSDRNRVLNNEVRNNGPYDGIGMITANFNVIDGNRVTDNNQSASNTAGIRIENAGRVASNDNVITNNQVTNSGIYGIEVFAGGSRNQIRSNQVLFNALDGITVFAGGNDNVIEGNNVRGNRGQGIFVRAAAGSFPAPAGNQILRNVSFGNTSSDLRDGQPTCGTNQWHGNLGGTGTPPCVFNP